MKNINPASHIIIKGARQHNLQNVDLALPKGKFIVFTGLSGSGKSSLAFDTIYAEGQRRYVESLSSYARQFLGIMQKPDMDQIEGLSPSISIDQKTTSHNPRSTVGTITEIYDYLRLLFARVGHPHCPECGSEIAPQSTDQIVDQVLQKLEDSTKSQPHSRWMILSPIVRDKKGEFTGLFENLRQKGFERVRVDGKVYGLNQDFVLLKNNKHSISAILDRITVSKEIFKSKELKNELITRLSQSIEQALELSDGLIVVSQVLDQSLSFPEDPKEFSDQLYSQHLACTQCNISIPEIEPRLFSFNTPHGACDTCSGLGTLMKFDPKKFLAPDISLSEGAIIPLASAFGNDTWFARKITTLVEENKGDVRTPFKNLSEEIQQKVLYGDDQKYYIKGTNSRGRETGFSDTVPGVIAELERRYEETSSDYVRTQLEQFMTQETCPTCQGARLNQKALSVTVNQLNIYEVTAVSIADSHEWISSLYEDVLDEKAKIFSKQEKVIAQGILKEIKSRLRFLTSVGLEYLTLAREAGTLAGGEAQRIRLASQIGTGLTGVLYVLDEPTIGLHPRDNDRLVETLKNLRDIGNTLIVVEHDEGVILSADQVIDFGPKAGEMGGQVIFQGTPEDLKKDKESLTGKYLSGRKEILKSEIQELSQKLQLHLPENDKQNNSKLVLKGAKEHNLKNIDAEFPLGKFVVITGVSGSGKSTLMHDTLYPALKLDLNQKIDEVGAFSHLTGGQNVDKVYLIDQSPIGRTPRSNPATYTKAFDHIRKIFANTKEAQMHGFKPGRFSFNVKGGRCEACSGDGQVKISMQFLADVYVTCDVCDGKRYNQQTLNIKYKGKNIAEVLDMTVDRAVDFFKNQSSLTRKLKTLQAVGLGYIRLGQPAPTLSGGEAQRVKLAKELSINSPGHTVYLLDEPTTGLHFEDTKKLLVVLRQLVNQNNTVIVIEHNLDFIKIADWIIDMGPEGGDFGGKIVATGTPENIAQMDTHTGRYLQKTLKK